MNILFGNRLFLLIGILTGLSVRYFARYFHVFVVVLVNNLGIFIVLIVFLMIILIKLRVENGVMMNNICGYGGGGGVKW